MQASRRSCHDGPVEIVGAGVSEFVGGCRNRFGKVDLEFALKEARVHKL
jgi:hypothetical protein